MEPLKCQYCPGVCYPYTYSNHEALQKNICARCYIAMDTIIKTKNKCDKCDSFHIHSPKFYIQCGTCNVCHPIWDLVRCSRSVKFSKSTIDSVSEVDRVKQYMDAFYARCENCSSFHLKKETILQCQTCKNCCTSLTMHKFTCLGGPPGEYKYTHYESNHCSRCNCSTCSTNNSLDSLSNSLMLLTFISMNR